MDNNGIRVCVVIKIIKLNRISSKINEISFRLHQKASSFDEQKDRINSAKYHEMKL